MLIEDHCRFQHNGWPRPPRPLPSPFLIDSTHLCKPPQPHSLLSRGSDAPVHGYNQAIISSIVIFGILSMDPFAWGRMGGGVARHQTKWAGRVAKSGISVLFILRAVPILGSATTAGKGSVCVCVYYSTEMCRCAGDKQVQKKNLSMLLSLP